MPADTFGCAWGQLGAGAVPCPRLPGPQPRVYWLTLCCLSVQQQYLAPCCTIDTMFASGVASTWGRYQLGGRLSSNHIHQMSAPCPMERGEREGRERKHRFVVEFEVELVFLQPVQSPPRLPRFGADLRNFGRPDRLAYCPWTVGDHRWVTKHAHTIRSEHLRATQYLRWSCP